LNCWRRQIGRGRQQVGRAAPGIGGAWCRRGDRDGVGPARHRPVGFTAKQRAVPTNAVDKQNVPSAAIRAIGIFFGKYGTFDTTAREMMRASAGAAAMLSRAVALRYLAR